jgi:hypothetical protein
MPFTKKLNWKWMEMEKVHRTLETEASDAGPASGVVLFCADQQAECIGRSWGAALDVTVRSGIRRWASGDRTPDWGASFAVQ